MLHSSSSRRAARLLLVLGGLVFIAWAFGALMFGEFRFSFTRGTGSGIQITPLTHPRIFWCSVCGAAIIGIVAVVSAIIGFRRARS
jgi:hypothetical protein